MGILLRLSAEEIEEVPLRHQRHEGNGQVAEIGEGDGNLAEHGAETGELLVRACEELVEDAQLLHDPQGGGVHRVAPEVAEEIGVLLHDGDVDALPGEQEAQHHARRAAAGDGDGGVDGTLTAHGRTIGQ